MKNTKEHAGDTVSLVYQCRLPLSTSTVNHLAGLLRRHPGVQPEGLADLADRDGPARTACGGENALVLRRERGLGHLRGPVRDQQHRLPAHLPGSRRCRGTLGGDLLAHPGQDPLRRREVLALGPDLCQLLDQPFFQIVQFRAACRDPLQHLGIHHAPDRREEKQAVDRNRRTALPDDLHDGHCPTTSPSSLTRHHTRGPDQPESRWRSFRECACSAFVPV